MGGSASYTYLMWPLGREGGEGSPHKILGPALYPKHAVSINIFLLNLVKHAF